MRSNQSRREHLQSTVHTREEPTKLLSGELLDNGVQYVFSAKASSLQQSLNVGIDFHSRPVPATLALLAPTHYPQAPHCV